MSVCFSESGYKGAILLHDSLDSRLCFNALGLILLPYNDRALDSSKHIPDLFLDRLRKRRPLGLDSSFGDLPNLRFKVSKALIARIIFSLGFIARMLSLRSHFEKYLVAKEYLRVERMDNRNIAPIAGDTVRSHSPAARTWRHNKE